MRQLAWLNTAPEPNKGEKARGQKPPARIARMKAEKLAIDLPDNPLQYLVDWLMEAGPLGVGGMGPVPISWQELEAWKRACEVSPTAWEIRVIRDLSRDFLDQMNKSREPTCPAPYTSGASNAEAVDAQFKKMFARMSNRKRERDG